jgi:transposase
LPGAFRPDVQSAGPMTAPTKHLHRELILNYFRAQKLISSGVVEGLINKSDVTTRNPDGFPATSTGTGPLSLT